MADRFYRVRYKTRNPLPLLIPIFTWGQAALMGMIVLAACALAVWGDPGLAAAVGIGGWIGGTLFAWREIPASVLIPNEQAERVRDLLTQSMWSDRGADRWRRDKGLPGWENEHVIFRPSARGTELLGPTFILNQICALIEPAQPKTAS